MSTVPTIPALQGKVTVDAPLERAFEVFTNSFGTWWPSEYHIGTSDMAKCDSRTKGRRPVV